jgi:hypothetical protein
MIIGANAEAARAMKYKDHHIEVSIRPVSDPNGWQPDIRVSYSEHGKSALKCPRMDKIFTTPNEAETAGIEFAQKWIDDGKPDVKPITREEIEKRMDELACEFAETHDPEIREKIYRLARQLKELHH